MAGWKYIKLNKTKAGQPGQWKESKRIEAVTTYLSTGSFTEVSRLLGIPIDTLHTWKKTEWWADLVKTIRAEEEHGLDTKLSKAVDKALDNLMDRIENGDYVYDQKTGGVKRVPAKLRDLNTAFNNVLDKRQLIRKQPTKIVEQQSTAHQLKNLAESFAKFVNKKVDELPDTHLIDGDTVEQNEDGTYSVKE